VRHGSVVGKPSQRYGVVVGRFNDLVTKLLLEGAKGAFQAHGVPLSNVEVCAGAEFTHLCMVGWCSSTGSAGQWCLTACPCTAWSQCVQVCWVPGSFELPVVAKAMAKSGKFDAVVCIGVVVS
jgi:6,7-dimethyl-8-ribityllumazine synthase